MSCVEVRDLPSRLTESASIITILAILKAVNNKVDIQVKRRLHLTSQLVNRVVRTTTPNNRHNLSIHRTTHLLVQHHPLALSSINNQQRMAHPLHNQATVRRRNSHRMALQRNSQPTEWHRSSLTMEQPHHSPPMAHLRNSHRSNLAMEQPHNSPPMAHLRSSHRSNLAMEQPHHSPPTVHLRNSHRMAPLLNNRLMGHHLLNHPTVRQTLSKATAHPPKVHSNPTRTPHIPGSHRQAI